METATKYPLMHLTAKEVIQLRQFTQNCKQNKDQHQVTDRKYTPTATEKGIIMLGKAGEVIVSRYYNTQIDWDIYIGADHGFDTTINNKTTEIKTSSQKSLIINDPEHCKYGLWKPDTEQCIVVWCNQPKTQWENIGTNTQFQIIGGTTRENFFANAQKTDYGYGPRLTLNENQLTHL
jgi:hypothetical protein